ncbi:MAG: GNAT family N-acetyltransferase [Wenzhouxiangella sp.]
MTEVLNPHSDFSLRWYQSSFEDLSLDQLYAVLAARVAVFVVEQDCPYPELDGLDASALHLWAAAPDGAIAAYARVTAPGTRFPEASVGRVLTSLPFRRTGLGRALMLRAMELAASRFPGQPLRISAQQYLDQFYTSLGFDWVRGPYSEDGIPHIEMLRPAVSE